MQSAALIVLRRWATSTTVLPIRAVFSVLDGTFCGGIQVAGGLIEDQDSGLAYQDPRDGQPLPLARRSSDS